MFLVRHTTIEKYTLFERVTWRLIENISRGFIERLCMRVYQ